MHKLVKALLTVAFSMFYTFSYAAANEPEINHLAQTFMEENHIPGMSIAVIDNGQIQTFNYGYANEVKKIPTNNNTIYTIASFSKTFTALLTTVATVEGKLNLNNSFTQYIPELNPNKNLTAITPSMLLGHVSSLPFNFTPAPTTYRAAIDDLKQFTPAYPPGSRFKYSNAGIGIMGYVLQNIYHQPYETILAEKITQPLQMNSTYLNVPSNKLQNIALGHDEHGISPYQTSIDVWFAAASLKSTIVDMAKYLNAQINAATLNNSTLSQALALVHQNKYCFANQESCEQLAWQAHRMSLLNSSEDDTFYYIDANGNLKFSTQAIVSNPSFPKNYFVDKTGSGYGMSSYMAYIPAKKLGVVILLNRSFLINKTQGDERIVLGRSILKTLLA